MKFRGELTNWKLLTGYTQEFIKEYALKYFKTIVKKPGTDNQVIHVASFYLIEISNIMTKNRFHSWNRFFCQGLIRK
jgi:protein SCO1